MGVDPARHGHAHHLPTEVVGAEDEVARYLALPHHALIAVDVGEEEVERGHALGEPPLQALPLGMRDDAGDEVEGEDPLRSLFLAVDGEGDALIQELDVGVLAALLEGFVAHPPELLEETPVVRTRLSGRLEHLVEEGPEVVASGERRLLLRHLSTHESHRG